MCNGGFMSKKSIRYLEVLTKVKEKKISQEYAAKELVMSVRQIYRLYQKLLKEGPSGFLSVLFTFLKVLYSLAIYI